MQFFRLAINYFLTFTPRCQNDSRWETVSWRGMTRALRCIARKIARQFFFISRNEGIGNFSLTWKQNVDDVGNEVNREIEGTVSFLRLIVAFDWTADSLIRLCAVVRFSYTFASVLGRKRKVHFDDFYVWLVWFDLFLTNPPWNINIFMVKLHQTLFS